MTFTKLDRGILQSSIMAEEPETFKVWIALLAVCDPDGIARVSAQYLSAIAHMPIETTRAALQRLEGPDEDSRSINDDGRRIQRVDGGYEVINYLVYRQRSLREAEAERKRLYRHSNPSILADESSRRRDARAKVRRHSPKPPLKIKKKEKKEGEGELEPSRDRPDDIRTTPQDGHENPPLPENDGLLPIPKGLPFVALDDLVLEQAEIRHLARMVERGQRQNGSDRISPEGLERRKQGFNQRIRDLS